LLQCNAVVSRLLVAAMARLAIYTFDELPTQRAPDLHHFTGYYTYSWLDSHANLP